MCLLGSLALDSRTLRHTIAILFSKWMMTRQSLSRKKWWDKFSLSVVWHLIFAGITPWKCSWFVFGYPLPSFVRWYKRGWCRVSSSQEYHRSCFRRYVSNVYATQLPTHLSSGGADTVRPRISGHDTPLSYQYCLDCIKLVGILFSDEDVPWGHGEGSSSNRRSGGEG